MNNQIQTASSKTQKSVMTKYYVTFLLTHIVAYLSINVYLSRVSGYTPDELLALFKRSFAGVVVAMPIIFFILTRYLSPIKKAMETAMTGEQVSTEALRKCRKVMNNYWYCMLAFNIVGYVLGMSVGITIKYLQTGVVDHTQWAILGNGLTQALLLTVFQNIIFSLIAIKDQTKLGFKTSMSDRKSALKWSVFANMTLILLAVSFTLMNNSWRTSRVVASQISSAVIEAVQKDQTPADIKIFIEKASEDVLSRETKKGLLFGLIMFSMALVASFFMAWELQGHVRVTLNSIRRMVREGSHKADPLIITTTNELGLINEQVNELILNNRAIINNVINTSNGLAETSGSLSGSSGQLSANVENLNARALSVTSATDEAGETVARISGSARDMSDSVGSVAQSIAELNQSLESVVGVCRKGAENADAANQETLSTQEMLEQLASATKAINSIVEMINDIAEQTNLLALNATIEAASAGEAGKGFAVVANEIKQLSKLTREQTEKIGSQIEILQSVSTGTIRAVKSVSTKVGELNNSSRQSADAVEEQLNSVSRINTNIQDATSSAAGIAGAVENASKGLSRIAENIEDVRTAVEVTSGEAQLIGKNSEALSSYAATLQQMLDTKKV